MALSSRLLPEPDGPSTTSRWLSVWKRTCNWKLRLADFMVLLMSISSCMGCVPSAVGDAPRRQAAGKQQHGHADRRGDQHQQVGDVVLAGLHRFVYGDGECLGLAGDAAGDHQRGTEFA